MSVRENLSAVLDKIRNASSASDRESRDVRLIAVSKNQSAEKIQEALNAGHRLFGENKVQEALQHWKAIKPLYPDLQIHLIGPLQTNKVSDAVALFDMIETVDREKLARKLGEEIRKQNRNISCLIQVNTGEETQKAGILPRDISAFLEFCRKDCGVDIRGLMCIPPVDEPPALHFALLKKLADTLALPELSMGMSGDFEKAIPLGATFVRVGTMIFGERST